MVKCKHGQQAVHHECSEFIIKYILRCFIKHTFACVTAGSSSMPNSASRSAMVVLSRSSVLPLLLLVLDAVDVVPSVPVAATLTLRDRPAFAGCHRVPPSCLAGMPAVPALHDLAAVCMRAQEAPEIIV